MNQFKMLFSKKWLVTLIGLLCVSILIWFIGPIVAIAGYVPLQSAIVRLVIIMVLLLLWGLNNLRIQAHAKKNNDDLINDISEDSKKIDLVSDEEVKLLSQRFDDALNVLKLSSKPGQGRQFLYELPWYVIIGPPGSGKTTALANSGLRFPLADKYGHESVKGVGGTRNCDWWFTDEAVLIDTAGRYTTQDSHAVNDSTAWKGFLNLLKKHRKRRPINGIIVAISIQDILIQTEEEKKAHIHSIRSRLLEIHDQFKIPFPVYLFITKSDLIYGFSEYFDDLGRDERNQVWGMTFANNTDSNTDSSLTSVALFNNEFDQLLVNINQRMISRLNYERDQQRRGKIVEFPSQLAGIKNQLSNFIEQTFASSRFHERPNLRGVYLTSGTQEGTPIDRIMDNIMDSFEIDKQDIPANNKRGKSYFVKNLLQKVIFSESELVGVNRKFENKILWIQRFTYAASISIAMIGALAWSTSFTLNERSIKRVDEKIIQYKDGITNINSNDLRSVNEQLTHLKVAEIIFPVDDNVPFSMQLGLYQGDNFHESIHEAYINQLNILFLPALKYRLEQQIRFSMSQPDYLFEALKAYLMLSLPQRLEKDFIEHWMAVDWNTSMMGEAEQQEQLKVHLQELLNSEFDIIQVDRTLVESARTVLKKFLYINKYITELNQKPQIQIMRYLHFRQN